MPGCLPPSHRQWGLLSPPGVGLGSGGGAEAGRVTGTASRPSRRESAQPSPGSRERLEDKAIFIYDSVSGLASV